VGVVLGAARVLGEVDHHLVEDVAEAALVLPLLGLEALGELGVGPPVEVGRQGVVLPVHQAVAVAEVVAAVEEAGTTEGQADRLGGVHVNLGHELCAGVGRVEAGRRRLEGVGREEVGVVQGAVDVTGGQVDVLAQRVGEELLADALLHAVQAAERRAAVVVAGEVAGQEQAEQRAAAAAVVVLGEGDRAGDGGLCEVVAVLVEADALVLADGQAGADDLRTAKPLRARVPQGDADHTTGHVTDVGRNATRDHADLLDGALRQGAGAPDLHTVDVVPGRARPRTADGDTAAGSRRAHTSHRGGHGEGVPARKLLDVFPGHRSTGRTTVAVNQRHGVLDDLGLVHHHTRPERGIDELDLVRGHLDAGHLLRGVPDEAEEDVIGARVDRLDVVLPVEIGVASRDLVAVEEQHHVHERKRFSGFHVGHLALQRTGADLRGGGHRSEQHQRQDGGEGSEGTEDGAGRRVAAGKGGVGGRSRHGLWRHESVNHTGFSAGNIAHRPSLILGNGADAFAGSVEVKTPPVPRGLRGAQGRLRAVPNQRRRGRSAR